MHSNDTARRLLSIREVAQRVGVGERSVLRELQRGRLKGLRFGRLWRVDEDDLYSYMRQNAEASVASR
jgi:excisionase family DNA binding protein